MECLVLSDTHGNYPLATKIVLLEPCVDLIIHLGDEADDAQMLEHLCAKQVRKVSGNCDPPGKHPRELLTFVEQTSLLITHGDRYGVKSGLSRLHQRAVSTGARVVLYGHTHIAAIDEIDGILFVNPGALAREASLKSYARLTFAASGTQARIVQID
jgi:putative phosphoesterase